MKEHNPLQCNCTTHKYAITPGELSITTNNGYHFKSFDLKITILNHIG